MEAGDKWAKLEEIFRRVVREELAQFSQTTLRDELRQLPLNFKQPKVEFVGGRFTGLTEMQLTAMREAYPAVDIDAELRRAAAWITNNPTNAPRSQIGRFVNSWMSKAQNQAALRSIPTQRELKAVPSLCEYCLSPSVGSVSGRRHCRAHVHDAMDGLVPPKMPGVQAKAVAGD